eukprot:m.5260 g.5260  ORF g.5260 m.5260 type:complete len:66 (-) comp7526_c0_seq3:9-206(-)
MPNVPPASMTSVPLGFAMGEIGFGEAPGLEHAEEEKSATALACADVEFDKLAIVKAGSIKRMSFL